MLFKPEFSIALITLFNGVALLYFSFYAHQIKINEERIKEIRDWIEEKEEVLNTLKDIAILKKISKIKWIKKPDLLQEIC